MTTARTPIRRITNLTVTFDRLGPVPARPPRVAPTYPPLTVAIPRHTAMSVDATIGYLTHYVREHIRMSLDVERFTVSIDLAAGGDGTVLVDGGRNGRGRIAATDR